MSSTTGRSSRYIEEFHQSINFTLLSLQRICIVQLMITSKIYGMDQAFPLSMILIKVIHIHYTIRSKWHLLDQTATHCHCSVTSALHFYAKKNSSAHNFTIPCKGTFNSCGHCDSPTDTVARQQVTWRVTHLWNVSCCAERLICVMRVMSTLYDIIIIIINNSICLHHISSNKTIQSRITLYMNIQITLKYKIET